MDKLVALWHQWIVGPIDQHIDLWGIPIFWIARVGILMQFVGIVLIVIQAQRETTEMQEIRDKVRAHAEPLQGRNQFHVGWYQIKTLLIFIVATLVIVTVVVGGREWAPAWMQTPLTVAVVIVASCAVIWCMWRWSRVLALEAEEFVMLGWPLLIVGTLFLALGH